MRSMPFPPAPAHGGVSQARSKPAVGGPGQDPLAPLPRLPGVPPVQPSSKPPASQAQFGDLVRQAHRDQTAPMLLGRRDAHGHGSQDKLPKPEPPRALSTQRTTTPPRTATPPRSVTPRTETAPPVVPPAPVPRCKRTSSQETASTRASSHRTASHRTASHETLASQSHRTTSPRTSPRIRSELKILETPVAVELASLDLETEDLAAASLLSNAGQQPVLTPVNFEVRVTVLSSEGRAFRHIVRRKFKDFRQLHRRALDHHVFSRCDLPPMPPRGWLREKLSPKFRRARLQELRRILRFIMLQDAHLRCEPLRDFLGLALAVEDFCSKDPHADRT